MIEMVRRLGNWSRLEMRAVIRFLWARNVSTSAIYNQIMEFYGEQTMSRQLVTKWCRSFQSGKKDVGNRNMAGSGRPSSSTTRIE
ncbi:histone-lysine N-methyltransferase SETMAR [Trichonephila clavipes]|nr:histone-lysine N-methyltransferase SETMAR [Trichonephila clavipes]